MNRWFALLLIVVIVFSLAACSNLDDEAQQPIIIEEKYDENGNLLMEPVNMGWNLWYYNEYTYDAGKLMNKKFCTDSGSMVNEWRYTYRENGVLENVEEYIEIVEVSLASVESYDEDGLLVKKQNYDTKGEIVAYYTFEYDERELCIKENYYDILWNGGDYPQSYVLYTYDDAGNCVRKDELNQHEDLEFYWLYSYDAKGNVTTEKQAQVLDSEEYVNTTQYTYHENGRIKDKISEGHGSRSEEVWEASGAMISEKHYEQMDSNEWTLWYTVEYSGDAKVWTTYMEDGRYRVERMKGSAMVVNWIKIEYYNADGSMFCSNYEGEFYDPSGNKMSVSPDISPWID